MKIENQVCSLELAKKLKELGVKQESLFWWRLAGQMGWQIENNWFMKTTSAKGKQYFSAFTVAELGEMLPESIATSKGVKFLYIWKDDADEWRIHYELWGNTDMPYVVGKEKTEADARAKMLIYLLENKLVTL